MSVPYGTPQPAVPQSNQGSLNLGLIMGLVAAGLALVIYAMSFSEEGLGFGDFVLPLLLAGGLLAGGSVLPKAPRTLLAGAVVTGTGVLLLLLGVVKSEGDTPAIIVVILIAGLLQLAACVVGLLVDAGVINLQPRRQAYGAPAWSPQSGSFPQQGQQYGQQQYPQQTQQYGQGQYGGQQPQAPGQHGQQHGQPGQQPQFGQQPYGQGQYGGSQPPQQQHPGTPPGGFSGPGQS